MQDGRQRRTTIRAWGRLPNDALGVPQLEYRVMTFQRSVFVTQWSPIR